MCRWALAYAIVMLRIGLGYDSHRLTPGRPLVLGGVHIEHEQGLAGHSDADAVLHAVTDAILGALAAGDIGDVFPDSDPRWADADSAVFVAEAMRLAAERGCKVANCDVTVLAEAPGWGRTRGGWPSESPNCLARPLKPSASRRRPTSGWAP